MNKQIQQKIDELMELCKKESEAYQADEKQPRMACIIIAANFTDQGVKTKVDTCITLAGGHSDLHDLVDNAQQQSPELAHFLKAKQDNPFSAMEQAVERMHRKQVQKDDALSNLLNSLMGMPRG